MKTTTIKLSGGILGSETMLVRCQLANAAAGVEVDYCMGEGWGPTQYQAGDARHNASGLAAVGIELAQVAVQEQGTCEWSEVEYVYVVRDASGEYVRNADKDDADSPCRSTASNEAQEFETREEAQAACRRATDRVLSREVE